MPGDNTEMTVALIQPIAMEEGLGFAIREGGRTVGSGRVTECMSRFLLVGRRGAGRLATGDKRKKNPVTCGGVLLWSLLSIEWIIAAG